MPSSSSLFAFLNSFAGLAEMRFDTGAVVLAIVLAVIAGCTMKSWARLDQAARDATLTYLLTLGALTVIWGGDFGMPTPLSLGFWLKAMLVFIFYELAIAAVFAIRRLLSGTLGAL